MRVAVAAIVLAVATDATAGLSVIRARGVADPEPHVEAILLVTPNQLSPADYELELDLPGADHSDKTVHGESVSPVERLPLRLMFVVDGSATFLAGANPSEEAGGSAAAGSGSAAPPTRPPDRVPGLPFVESALQKIATSFAGNAQFGVIIVDRQAATVLPLGTEPPGRHPLGTEVDRTIDDFDVNAGLTAALDGFPALKEPHEDAIIVIGIPRTVLAADVKARLAQSRVDIFTLQVEPNLHDRAKWAALADDSRRLGTKTAAGLPQLADRLVGQLSSVVRVSFPVPPDAFDGSTRDLTFKLGPEHAIAKNVPFGRGRSTPVASHDLRWLVIGAALAAMLVIGMVMLLARSRRETSRRPVIRTEPLPPPPTGPKESRHEDTATLAVPPAWFAAWFYVREGSRRGEFLALKRAGTTTVGRSDRANIKIDDTAVRPLHAKLNAQVGRVTIVAVPEGETVRVAGKDVSRLELTDGMIVEFGSAKLLFKVTR